MSITTYIRDPEGDQILYYFDRPRYKFPVKEEGDTLIKSQGVKWINIGIEFPTRPMLWVTKWIESKRPRDLLVVMQSDDNKLYEEWEVKSASVRNSYIKRGRTVGLRVISVSAEYKWARKTVK